MHGSLAGHYRRGWFTVRGWSNGSWSHVALALRVPPGATGATAPLRRELVRWAGWAVWRLPHWHWDMVQLGAEKIYKCSSLIPKLFATPIAANPKAQRMLSSRLDRFQASKSYAWKNIPSKFVRLWKLEVAPSFKLWNDVPSLAPTLEKSVEFTWHQRHKPSFFRGKRHREDHLCDRCSASGNLFGEGCGEHLPRGDLSWWWAFGLYGSYELNAGDLILNLFDLHNYI